MALMTIKNFPHNEWILVFVTRKDTYILEMFSFLLIINATIKDKCFTPNIHNQIQSSMLETHFLSPYPVVPELKLMNIIDEIISCYFDINTFFVGLNDEHKCFAFVTI